MVQRDLNSSILTKYISWGSLIAAGAGDNTLVSGALITTANGKEEYYSGILSVNYVATLTTSSNVQFRLSYDESSDGTTYGADTLITLLTPAVNASTTQTAQQVSGILNIPINLVPRAKYIHFNVKPDASAAGTDTCSWFLDLTVNGKLQPVT